MNQFRLVTYLLFLLVAAPTVALAAVNAVTAGVGGVNNGTLQWGDGSGAARVVLNAVSLPLSKQARTLAGNIIPSGGSVAPGQVITFVLQVTNTTPYAVNDVQVIDQLNEAEFTYLPGSLETAAVTAGAGDAALWGAAWSLLTDDPGGADDIASFGDSGGPPGRDRLTVGAYAGQLNRPLSIPGNTAVALRFRVRVN